MTMMWCFEILALELIMITNFLTDIFCHFSSFTCRLCIITGQTLYIYCTFVCAVFLWVLKNLVHTG